MSKKRRISRLEKQTAPPEPIAIVVVYTDERVGPQDTDERVVIYLPDNGRGDHKPDQRQAG